MISLISLIFHWGNSFKVIFFISFWFSKFIMKVKLTLCKPFINVKHTKITVSRWQVCKPNINDFFLHENTCLFDNKSEFRLQLFPHGLNHWDQTISQLLYCLKESIRSEKLAIITHKVKKWQINTELMTDLNFALQTF